MICLRCHDYRKQDLILGAILYFIIPCHLFAAFIIELAAAQQAKGLLGRRKKMDSSSEIQRKQREADRKDFQKAWRTIFVAHTLNATLCLLVTTIVVYCFIHHPGVGTISEVHAVIVWLKICSYAFTNRDLRRAMLRPSEVSPLPDLYKDCPYPRNITFGNLAYFWWAPTLLYQPVYPRTNHIRWGFVVQRLFETAGLLVFIWLASAQYAVPVLQNSLDKIAVLNIAAILERTLKLSTISLVIWLAGFWAIFQSMLNVLAEIMKFGDREFYTDWWNSPSVGAYWRTWNKPVYQFMRRHIYFPLVDRGWRPFPASAMVFIFSGVMHEILVGVPTHNILGEQSTLNLISSYFANNITQASHLQAWSSSSH